MVSPRLTRQVWAAVTADPQASYPEIARQIGHSTSQVCNAMRRLCALGYIEHAPMRARARRVLVPFVEV